MDKQRNHQQIKDIYRMLLEIANGNLGFRIPVNGQDKSFNELVQLLNKVAEMMEKVGYVNPYNKHKSFELNADDPVATLVQKVQDYIINNLEEPLPSTKELSDMFGTNEFTLKESFRNFLKTSVYQYYNEERLKKAYMFIQQSNLPLQEVAYISGFNNYTNFYKAFKKRFKLTPSEIQRINNDTKEP